MRLPAKTAAIWAKPINATHSGQNNLKEKSIDNKSIEVILLDLGGVLVELDSDRANGAWFDSSLTTEENWRRWLGSPDAQALEKGLIDAEEYASTLIRDHGLDTTPVALVSEFKSWVVGFYPGVFEILDSVDGNITLGVFSNITAVHWPEIECKLRTRSRVSHFFASYLIGRAKPDPDAFRFVCEQMTVRPQSVLFVDDNQSNVEGARQAGLIAEVTAGPDALMAVLDRYGLST